jgi:pimeloyl-ACP methyl ester carboxylesterase
VDSCPGPTPINLEESLARFGREAAFGQCDTGRYRCRFYTWGEGPPLLFIHGLCDDARSFLLPIACLSRHFRCIAYDLPAGGDDGACLPDYRHADLVADVYALLDHLGVNRCDVFGSSFGSTIALAAMHDRPERFERGILQGGFAHRPLAWAEVLLARLARYWPWAMHRLPLRVPVLRRSHGGPFSGRGPEFWQFFLERNGAPPMNACARRALLLHAIDIRRLLPDIKQPVLLICGDADPLVGRACEEVLENGLPQATRVEITQCGHLPQFTHPEVLAEVVRRFLAPLACSQIADCRLGFEQETTEGTEKQGF